MRTLPPPEPRPLTVPVRPTGVTVTLFVEALKFEATLPKLSIAVTVLTPVNEVLLICGLVNTTENLLRPAGVTVAVN